MTEPQSDVRARPSEALGETSAHRVRTALRRMIGTVETRPDKAIGTAVTRVRVREGMTCEVEEGDWGMVVDLPERWGGGGLGPNPGQIGRGALGACLSMAYMRFLADAGITVDRLDIEIQADYDARGELGMADVTPAYTEVRYVVRLESPASEEDIRRVLDRAEDCCPYLQVFATPLPMRRELHIAHSGDRPAGPA